MDKLEIPTRKGKTTRDKVGMNPASYERKITLTLEIYFNYSLDFRIMRELIEKKIFNYY